MVRTIICAMLVLAGCTQHVRLSPMGGKVRVSSQEAVDDCRFLKMVSFEAGTNFKSLEHNIQLATNRIRNDAGALGATHLVLEGPERIADSTVGRNCRNCVYVAGRAFRCRSQRVQAPPESTTAKPAATPMRRSTDGSKLSATAVTRRPVSTYAGPDFLTYDWGASSRDLGLSDEAEGTTRRVRKEERSVELLGMSGTVTLSLVGNRFVMASVSFVPGSSPQGTQRQQIAQLLEMRYGPAWKPSVDDLSEWKTASTHIKVGRKEGHNTVEYRSRSFFNDVDEPEPATAAKDAAVDNPAPDFRGNYWGTTKEQVGLRTGRSFSSSGLGVFLGDERCRVVGLKCSVSFYFLGAELVRGLTSIREEHSNKNDFILDYERLKAGLNRKYGAPTRTDVRWRNDLFRENPDAFGMAVGLGHLIFESTWETATTTIDLVLSGDNSEVLLAVMYTSRKHSEAIRHAADQVDVEGL